MNNEKLKPCPFCGGEAHIFGHTKSWGVLCTKCYVSTLNYETEAAAIAAWNGRVCVKQNGISLDTNSVASSGVNAKLTYADIKKMVKPLEWVEDTLYAGNYPISRAYFDGGLYLYATKNSCRLIDKNNRAGGNFEISDGNEFGLNKNKELARKWLVDFAAALGVERSGE
jgi:Lar family restriction alleviation protein